MATVLVAISLPSPRNVDVTHTAAPYAALSRETCVPADVLRTFAGISDPAKARQFSRDALAAHLRGRRHADFSFGAQAAQLATRVTFPPPPPAVAWDELDD